MKINDDLLSFIAAARKLDQKQLLPQIETYALNNLQMEIGEDPEIEKVIKKMLQ